MAEYVFTGAESRTLGPSRAFPHRPFRNGLQKISAWERSHKVVAFLLGNVFSVSQGCPCKLGTVGLLHAVIELTDQTETSTQLLGA